MAAKLPINEPIICVITLKAAAGAAETHVASHMSGLKGEGEPDGGVQRKIECFFWQKKFVAWPPPALPPTATAAAAAAAGLNIKINVLSVLEDAE